MLSSYVYLAIVKCLLKFHDYNREVIMRKPEVFKMACLRDIQRLFGEFARNPFYAGFGNRITDALSYRSVNVPSARIFTIDTTGEVKMELLELAGYKSSYVLIFAASVNGCRLTS